MTATKKVVINDKYGGFGLSARAHARLAELQGRPCYFFVHVSPMNVRDYRPATVEEAEESFIFFAFDTPDAHETLLGRDDDWHDLTMEQRQARNAEYKSHQISDDGLARHDPLLIQIVEELGDAASRKPTAELKIVEIPADVDYTIEEYDGNEWIAEAHRTWR